jgi:hypothetical protein
MQLSELLDKLHDVYDREGDIDVFVTREGRRSRPFPLVFGYDDRRELEL